MKVNVVLFVVLTCLVEIGFGSCATEDVECGERFFGDHFAANANSNGYIVGGHNAERGSLPWQVSIQTYGHFCGGTIISKRWILSAAHCFERGSKGVKIVAGEHDLGYTDGSEQKISVVRNFNHPQYDSKTSKNDICLLELSQDLRFDSYTQPACLPKLANENADYAAGDNVIVSGWGSTRARGATILQVATVPLIADSTCNQRKYYGGRISYSMVCAGKLGEGGVDTCKGDSGGPLVKKISDKWTVLGVTSWGFGCARPNKPGVYARVARFEKWIHDTISHRTTCGGNVNLAKGGKATASSFSVWPSENWSGDGSFAFAGPSKQWHSKTGMPQWVQYELVQPAAVCKVSFLPRLTRMPRVIADCPRSYKIQGSDDGSNFHTLLSVKGQKCQKNVRITQTVNNQRAFKFYRLTVVDVLGRKNGNKFGVIRDLKLFGK